jgi:peptide/nickel transport system permease protein
VTDRLVSIQPTQSDTPISTTVAAGAAAGPAAAAMTEVSAPRKKLGWLFWVCVAWIVLVILAAIFASVLPIQNPNAQLSRPNLGPSTSHFFGTDDLGRDIFSRIVYGARVSLVIGFGAMAIALLLGGTAGMIAAYRRGATDTIVNAASYVLLAFPALIALITIVTFWGKQEWKITLIVGISAAPLVFRVVRASTLSYATRDFVTAAKAMGARTHRIIVREILPNALPTIVSFTLIGVAVVIVLEGTLAFLGLSVPPPTPSWGNMLNEARTALTPGPQYNPWLTLFPALAMFLFLVSLNLVGDRLREYFDITEVKL